MGFSMICPPKKSSSYCGKPPWNPPFRDVSTLQADAKDDAGVTALASLGKNGAAVQKKAEEFGT